MFRNHDNAFAELHVSGNRPQAGSRIEIRGEAGWLEIQTNPPRLSGRLSCGRQLERRYWPNRAAERLHRAGYGCSRAMVAELNVFVSRAKVFFDQAASGWDGYRVTEMIEAINQPHRTGDEVPINPTLVQIPSRSNFERAGSPR